MKKVIMAIALALSLCQLSIAQIDFATEITSLTTDNLYSHSISKYSVAGNSGYFVAGEIQGAVAQGFLAKTDDYGNPLWQDRISNSQASAVFVHANTNGDALVAARIGNTLEIRRYDNATGNIASAVSINQPVNPTAMKRISISGVTRYAILGWYISGANRLLNLTVVNNNGSVIYSRNYSSSIYTSVVENVAAFTQKSTGDLLIAYGNTLPGLVTFEVNEVNGVLIPGSINQSINAGAGNVKIADIIEIAAVSGTGRNYVISGQIDDLGFIGLLDNAKNYVYGSDISLTGSYPSMVGALRQNGSVIEYLQSSTSFNNAPRHGYFGRVFLGTSSLTLVGSTDLVNSLSTYQANLVAPFNFAVSNAGTPVFASHGGTRSYVTFLNNSYNLTGCPLLASPVTLNSRNLIGISSPSITSSFNSVTTLSRTLNPILPFSNYACGSPCATPIAGITISQSGGICSTGGGSVTLTANPPAGGASYAYIWAPSGEITTSINVTSAGTYTVTLIDLATGCKGSQTATVISDDNVSMSTHSISSSSGSSFCINDNPHAFEIIPAPNATSPTHIWRVNTISVGTNPTLLHNFAPTYGSNLVEVNYLNACGLSTLSLPITLQGFTGTINPTQIACAGQTGSMAFSVSTSAAGSAPFSYLWNTGATTSSITGLAAGNYTVTVTDNNGCSQIYTETINAAPAALSVSETVIHESCGNANDGRITLSVSGGTPSYSYAWSNGSTGIQIINQPPGTYSYTVTDANGCTVTGSETINAATGLTLFGTATVTDASCVGLDDGQIVLGFSGSLTYQWNTGATTSSISNLAGGTYTVTISDGANCEVVSYVVNQPNAGWTVFSENSSDGVTTVDIEHDPDKNVYVMGTYIGSVDFFNGAVSISSGTAPQGYFVAKYDQCGEFQWVAYTESSDPSLADGAIDFEIHNNDVFALSKRRAGPVAGSPDYILNVIDNTNTLISSSNLTYSTGWDYNLARIDNAGSIVFFNLVEESLSDFDFTSVQPYNAIDDVFIGGKDLNNLDAFIGEYNNTGSTYTVSTNVTATSGDEGIVTDLEFFDDGATGRVYASGEALAPSSSVAGISIAGGASVSGINDAFVVVFDDATNIGSSSVDAEIAGATEEAIAREIDVVSSDDFAMIFVVGDYFIDLNNWGPISTGLNRNVFMTRLDYSATTSSITHNWTQTAEDSPMQHAFGYGVEAREDGDLVHFGGTFNGSHYEVQGIGDISAGSAATDDQWHVGFFNNSSYIYTSTVVSQENLTCAGVVETGRFAYSAGDFQDNLDYDPSTLAPLAYPGGMKELFAVRYDADPGANGEYMKTDPFANTVSGVSDLASEANEDLGITLLPNPTQGTVYITLEGDVEATWSVAVYSSVGQLVADSPNQPASNKQLELDLHELPAGLYFVRTTRGEQVATHRLVVQ